MVCASEVGAVFIPPEKVVQKGRLKPGRMLLVDTQEGRIVDDKELKLTTARSKPFAAWIESNILNVPNIVKRVKRTQTISPSIDNYTLSVDPKLMAFRHTIEHHLLMLSMVNEEKESLGFMVNDAPQYAWQLDHL